MISKHLSDPQWQEYSASLRKGSLYVKLPRTQARMLSGALERVLQALERKDCINLSESKTYLTRYAKFLKDEIDKALVVSQPMVIYAATLDYATDDAKHLRLVEHLDLTATLVPFQRCLEAGLRGDPEVDWVTRVGGPKPDLSGLEPNASEEILLLDDVEMNPWGAV